MKFQNPLEIEILKFQNPLKIQILKFQSSLKNQILKSQNSLKIQILKFQSSLKNQILKFQSSLKIQILKFKNPLKIQILKFQSPLKIQILNSKNSLKIQNCEISGTSEFVLGLYENVTVLIGIAFNDSAIGGVIHQPFFKCPSSGKSGRTIWGLKGIGTGGFTPAPPPQDKLVLTTTRSHATEIVNSTINAVAPDEVLKVGGCGFKVLQLLEGKAHCYVFASPGCKKWDTCAPETILEVEGGILTDIRGDHYKYGAEVEFPNKSGVLATAPGVDHAKILQRIPESVKSSLGKK